MEKCVATFSGVSDIAGPGIIISFVVTSVLTTVTALIHAYSPDSKKTFFKELFELKTLASSTLSRKAIISRNQRSRQWIHELTSVLLEGLCDVQLMTGMAITAAGLAQRNDISLYHLAIIYNLWLLTTNSLWAAQSPAFGSMRGYQGPDSHSGLRTSPTWYQARLRGLCIVISVILGSLVQYELIRRIRAWNHDESGQCYRPPSALAPGSEWYFFAVRCIYLTDVIVEELLEVLRVTAPDARRFADARGPCETLMKQVQKACSSLDRIMEDVSQNSKLTGANAAYWYQYLPKWAGMLVVATMLWISLQWLATCAIGEGTPRLTILVYCAYTMWAMHDIIALKVRNAELIQGSESEWEFGQVLSIVLLVYILFSIIDASEKATNWEKSRRKEQEVHDAL